MTKDVSAGGACFVMEELFTPGTKLELEIQLPDREAPIMLIGEVIWSKPMRDVRKSSENPTAETGVKFVSIAPDDQKLLLLYTRLNAPLTDRGCQ